MGRGSQGDSYQITHMRSKKQKQKFACHVKTTVRRTTPSRGVLRARYLDAPGDNAVELPRAPAIWTGPLPRRKAPGIPSKIQLV